MKRCPAVIDIGVGDNVFMAIEMEIWAEIYTAFEQLGADKELLATIGSWGDTLEDGEVLDLLKTWNAGD